MHVVTVEFQIDTAHWEAFLPLMLENAARSRDDEPGCRQFAAATGAMIWQRSLLTWTRISGSWSTAAAQSARKTLSQRCSEQLDVNLDQGQTAACYMRDVLTR